MLREIIIMGIPILPLLTEIINVDKCHTLLLRRANGRFVLVADAGYRPRPVR